MQSKCNFSRCATARAIGIKATGSNKIIVCRLGRSDATIDEFAMYVWDKFKHSVKKTIQNNDRDIIRSAIIVLHSLLEMLLRVTRTPETERPIHERLRERILMCSLSLRSMHWQVCYSSADITRLGISVIGLELLLAMSPDMNLNSQS